MFRIDDATAATSLPTPEAASTEGYFTEGNPTAGTPATNVRGSWLNMIQEELRAVVVAGGITPSKTTYNQVYLAIQKLIGSGKPLARLLTITIAGSGSFTVPAGVFGIYYRLWAGGGGGGGGGTSSAGNAAGAGGYVEGWLTVTPGQVIPYVVGAGGNAGSTASGGTAGTAGGTSTFNTTISATGGGFGNGGGTGGGVAGVGSGADFNATGTSGTGPSIAQGTLYLAPPGGGAYGVGPTAYGYGQVATPGRNPGGGGSGGVGSSAGAQTAGGAGAAGALYIWG